MAKQIIIPSSTPTRIGNFGISSGNADSVIEFPEVNGTVAVINSQGIINATASYALSSPGGGGSGTSGTSGISGTSGTSGGGGGSLSGTQYLYVTANGTDTQNAEELQAAYDAAKLMSPSSTNRITIVAGPGNYNFGTGSFVMDTEYIDFVSLDGNKSVIFNAPLNTEARTEGSISITANYVFVKGIDVQDKNFTVATDLFALHVENCKGGDFSFGGVISESPITLSGTFTRCIGGLGAFGGVGGDASGDFIDCTGGLGSFGGGSGGSASGNFTGCVGGQYSFGGGGDAVASGVFVNCVADADSFGGSGVSGTASGTFTNCIAGSGSFGAGGSSVLTGKLFYCRLTSGSFQIPSGGGKIRLCLDGTDTEVNAG